ncbi:hypothetical protein G6K96_21475 [Agrobacterium vitis]|uniref:ribbon-helix-helix domain-containing protein n=1 Tax=Agrobacterium vitis TaxID=373 RepID=UPI001571C065|nr:ribbon-helix-helix domain-containing protein [Agrobacterium vitis]NTA34305.1 hypothetical protein [Agrobacterium vitis]
MVKLLLPISLSFMYNINMNQSISVKHKKKGRPATGKTPIAGVRISDEISAALDAYVAGNSEIANRSEAIRQILQNWLVDHGYLPK